jgi:hypothetical protein
VPEADVAEWIELPCGKLLNLDLCTKITVSDSNQQKGRFAVLIFQGGEGHFVDDFSQRADAEWLARTLAFGEAKP